MPLTRYVITGLFFLASGIIGVVSVYGDESFAFAWGSVFEGIFLMVVVGCFFVSGLLFLAMWFDKSSDDGQT